MRGDEHEAPHAGGGTGAERIADAVDRPGRLFHGERALAQLVARYFRVVEQLKVGDIAGQIALVGKTGIGVLGRHLGHGDGAFRERLQVEAGIGRHGRHLATDEDAQRKVVALRGFR